MLITNVAPYETEQTNLKKFTDMKQTNDNNQ